jgi:hypothetical protein
VSAHHSNDELLPEHKVLEDKIPTAREEADEHSEPQEEKVEHGLAL